MLILKQIFRWTILENYWKRNVKKVISRNWSCKCWLCRCCSKSNCFNFGFLIPFLEHDDANRALMGSNMMRRTINTSWSTDCWNWFRASSSFRF
jgi:hypothetical protein